MDRWLKNRKTKAVKMLKQETKLEGVLKSFGIPDSYTTVLNAKNVADKLKKLVDKMAETVDRNWHDSYEGM